MYVHIKPTPQSVVGEIGSRFYQFERGIAFFFIGCQLNYQIIQPPSVQFVCVSGKEDPGCRIFFKDMFLPMLDVVLFRAKLRCNRKKQR